MILAFQIQQHKIRNPARKFFLKCLNKSTKFSFRILPNLYLHFSTQSTTSSSTSTNPSSTYESFYKLAHSPNDSSNFLKPLKIEAIEFEKKFHLDHKQHYFYLFEKIRTEGLPLAYKRYSETEALCVNLEQMLRQNSLNRHISALDISEKSLTSSQKRIAKIFLKQQGQENFLSSPQFSENLSHLRYLIKRLEELAVDIRSNVQQKLSKSVRDSRNSIDEQNFEFHKIFHEFEQLYLSIHAIGEVLCGLNSIDGYVMRSDVFIKKIKLIIEHQNSSNKHLPQSKPEIIKKMESLRQQIFNLFFSACQMCNLEISEHQKTQGSNNSDSNLPKTLCAKEPMGPLRQLAQSHFEELRCLYQDFMSASQSISQRLLINEKENHLQRLIEARNIARAKWNMRASAFDIETARSLAKKEGVGLDSIEVELEFRLPFSREDLKKIRERLIESITTAQDQDLAQQRKNKETYSSITSTSTHRFSAPNDSYLNTLASDLLQILNKSSQQTLSNQDKSNTFQSSLMKELSSALNQKEQAPSFVDGSLHVGPDLSSLKEDFDYVFDLSKRNFDEFGLWFPKEMPAHRKPEILMSEAEKESYKQQKNERESKLKELKLNIDNELKSALSTRTKLRIRFDSHADDAPALNQLLQLYADNKLCGKTSKNSILHYLQNIRFCGFTQPNEITEYQQYRRVLLKDDNLAPWFDDNKQKLLGIDPETRLIDDPIPSVEDDMLSDYQWQVGLGVIPSDDPVSRVDVSVRISNDFVMDNLKQILYKHVRSLVVSEEKCPDKHHRFTMRKSAHVHGDAKDHWKITRFKHVFHLFCPLSQKFRLERMSEDMLTAGAEVSMKWERNI